MFFASHFFVKNNNIFVFHLFQLVVEVTQNVKVIRRVSTVTALVHVSWITRVGMEQNVTFWVTMLNVAVYLATEAIHTTVVVQSAVRQVTIALKVKPA